MRVHSTYSEYRDSGVAWLGKLPLHWSALRGSAFLVECRKRNDGLKSENYLSLMANRGVIPYAEKGAVGNKKPEDLTKCKIVESGDFVINSMNYSIGSYGLSRYDGVCSPVYVVMKHNPELVDEKFVDLILSNAAYQNYAQSFGTGILEHRRAIGWDEIKKIVVGIPPLNEQREIANWTESQTSRIDILISKKTKFIELLKEKRQAVITKAVTKGLDNSVSKKDSKIRWIGHIPEHWTVLKGGLIGNLFGSEQVSDESIFPEGELPFLKVGSLSTTSFNVKSWDWFVEANVAKKCKPRSNFIVFPKRGAAIFTNKVNIVERPSVIDPNLMGWEIGNKAIVKYIAYALKSRRLDDLADVSTIPQINNKHIGPERFPLPPIDEQREISSYLDKEMSKLDSIMEKTERSIELLKEHRSALITAAVTGKIDVRETK